MVITTEMATGYVQIAMATEMVMDNGNDSNGNDEWWKQREWLWQQIKQWKMVLATEIKLALAKVIAILIASEMAVATDKALAIG